MAGGLLKGVTLLAIGSAAGAGGYAYYLTTQSRVVRQEVVACREDLDGCKRGRGDLQARLDEGERRATEALEASRAELEELRAERAETEKRLAAFKALTEKFRKMIDSGKLQVVLRHGRMVVKLPAEVLFASGSADLSKEGKDALRDVASILKHVHDRRFMVAGHTDNVPVGPPSPFKNNLELSTARSLTVAQHLVASGMPPARLVAAGYSEHEPIRDNRSEAGRRENRRIEIVLLPHVTELPNLGDVLDAGAPHAALSDAGR